MVSVKSPVAPLCQRGEMPPFGKGRLGGIFEMISHYYETVNKLVVVTIMR